MKTVIAAALFAISGLAAAAQAPVPVTSEPRHHLKFENSHVRVFDVVVPPGDATLFHTHASDYAFVSIGDANLKAEVMGSPAVDLILKNGETRFTKATITHRVMNQSKVAFRNITIEILGSPGAAGVGPSLESVPGHSLIFENDRVRAWRLVLRPGESTGMHRHAHAGLGVSVSGGELSLAPEGVKAQRSTLKPGDFRWHEAGTSHLLKNVGKSTFEAVDIEWK